jgi:hypothetical protein
MDSGHVLPATGDRAAKAEARQPQQTSKTPPRSGLITMAARMLTLRVCGVSACSYAFAISTL